MVLLATSPHSIPPGGWAYTAARDVGLKFATNSSLLVWFYSTDEEVASAAISASVQCRENSTRADREQFTEYLRNCLAFETANNNSDWSVIDEGYRIKFAAYELGSFNAGRFAWEEEIELVIAESGTATGDRDRLFKIDLSDFSGNRFEYLRETYARHWEQRRERDLLGSTEARRYIARERAAGQSDSDDDNSEGGVAGEDSSL